MTRALSAQHTVNKAAPVQMQMGESELRSIHEEGGIKDASRKKDCSDKRCVLAVPKRPIR